MQPAIEKVVAERRDEMDCVERYEADCRAVDVAGSSARLAERYFADFSGARLDFLNSLRWQRGDLLMPLTS
ncbi:hypothetical protein J4734_20350 [Klebsiella pneumoniae]|uniref:Uncharacterized protein n=1 Tax=Klebsiella pneumoniae TaxID=573 RepID=A0A939NPA8_KLEPN|nr:hypothetical protein [Klebsiella pneumoniae]